MYHTQLEFVAMFAELLCIALIRYQMQRNPALYLQLIYFLIS
jgi:hypothetical protein